MTTYLVATASVHTTAAASDFLGDVVDADDAVVGLSVDDPTLAERDAGDALNVLRTRLPGVQVETRTESAGDPANVIRKVAEEIAADTIVLGSRRGDPDAAGERPGSTVRAVLAAADRPVIVVPVPEL